MIQQPLDIINKLGLHARAASKFVKLASSFQSEIRLRKGEREANGKSIMGVMMLAASCGTRLELLIDGQDEQLALVALQELVGNKFGEGE
jgi:phosphocarrier protein